MIPFEEAKKQHRRAIDGNVEAARAANALLQTLREAKPNDALIEAYYGSSLALLARDAVQPLERAELAQEALDALHRAVAMNPNHKEVRMLRGNVCLRLPDSFFHCASTAVEDFTFLLERYASHATDPLTPKQLEDVRRNLENAKTPST